MIEVFVTDAAFEEWRELVAARQRRHVALEGLRMAKPHLLTMSAPNLVRLEIHVPETNTLAWVAGSPEEAIHNAWMILDSARRACEKGKRETPAAVVASLSALAGGGFDR